MELLMDEVCGYIHNYFPAKPGGIHRGTFTIRDGMLTVDFLQPNQYFRVIGSVFNDGVWMYQSGDMVDETFTGAIWAMNVPPAFIALLQEIEQWVDKYGGADSVNMSPFNAESFNNYSYTKSGVARSNASSGGPTTWDTVYGSRLVRWKKL